MIWTQIYTNMTLAGNNQQLGFMTSSEYPPGICLLRAEFACQSQNLLVTMYLIAATKSDVIYKGLCVCGH